MFRPRWLILPSLLLLSLGCVNVKDSGTLTTVTVTGQYRDPGTGTLKPTRYCWAEVYDVNTGGITDSGYLGANGQGTFAYPSGDSVQVLIYARVEVPDGSSFTLRGSVKNAALAASYSNAAAFNAVADVSLSSVAGSGSSLTLTAEPDSAQTDQAFNAADQMVVLGQGLKALQSGIRLPNLHAFFTPSRNTTGYPQAVLDGSHQVLQQSSGRAIFALPVAGNATGAASTNNDLTDDAVLLEAYSHLLFADYSLYETGSSPLSYLRRDNEDVSVERDFQSEPTLAFATGYADFLACAFRSLDGATNPQLITDTQISAGGSATTYTFDLSNHAQFARVTNQGEFYRGSVAISLWQSWKVALGGGVPALQTLWDATARNQPGEYLNAPLGAYPTYLLGLKNLLGPASANWSNTLFQLGLEDVQDPTPAYFASTALWTTAPGLPFLATGSLTTYAPATGIYTDRDQAVSYRFTHPGGALTIQMTPTGGQDFFLELIGPDGVLDMNTTPPVGAPPVRTITKGAAFPAGTYVARIRAGYTTATGTAGYSLSVTP